MAPGVVRFCSVLLCCLVTVGSWAQSGYQNRREEMLVRVDLSRSQVKDCLLTGAVFISTNLREAGFERSDLSSAKLRDSKLDAISLTDVVGDGLQAQRLTLTRPKLSSSSLTALEWDSGTLSGRLQNIEITGLKLYRCGSRDLLLDHLTGRDLVATGLDIDGLRASDCELSDVQLSNVQMPASRWSRVEAQRSRLEDVELQDSRLDDCDLSYVRAEGCDLSHARFDRCDLRGLVINGYDIEELIRRAER